MKWFWSQCRRRKDASLLAAGVLSAEEKIAAERHLSECAECRAYFDSVKLVVAPLSEWDSDYAFIQVTQAARTRWAAAVAQVADATSAPSPTSSPNPDSGLLRTAWRELILPSRHVWSALAALWVAMLIVNARLSDASGARAVASPQEILRAWEEQERAFAEWDHPRVIDSAAPARIPSPRSQMDQNRIVI